GGGRSSLGWLAFRSAVRPCPRGGGFFFARKCTVADLGGPGALPCDQLYPAPVVAGNPERAPCRHALPAVRRGAFTQGRGERSKSPKGDEPTLRSLASPAA